MTSIGTVDHLAGQVCAFEHKQDAKATARARMAVTRAFGQVLAGVPAPATKSLLDTSGVAISGGSSLIFGTERRTAAADAALINATAAGSVDLGGAASTGYIVSLYGLCEERKKSGKEFVDALIFGAEVARSLAPAFTETDTSSGQLRAAMFGCIVAASRLIDLSRPRIATALRIGGLVHISELPAGQAGLSALLFGLGMKNGLLAVAIAETMDERLCAAEVGSDAAGKNAPSESGFDLLACPSPPGADLWDQFEAQAGVVLSRDQVAPLFERLETIDKVNDLATVSRLLQGRGAPSAAAKIVFAPRGTHESEETTWVP